MNFLGRYQPNMSTILRLVAELLEKDKEWLWGKVQSTELAHVKELSTKAPTLAYFDLSKPTIVT